VRCAERCYRTLSGGTHARLIVEPHGFLRRQDPCHLLSRGCANGVQVPLPTQEQLRRFRPWLADDCGSVKQLRDRGGGDDLAGKCDAQEAVGDDQGDAYWAAGGHLKFTGVQTGANGEASTLHP
jgi:hypothetical protein